MENNTKCKSIGKGTVKIKLHDGTVRIVSDVMHIPNLRRNLISVGAFDSKGCKVSTIGLVMKLVKGVMVS